MPRVNVDLFEETLAFFQGDELRTRTFLDKYALRDIEGNIVERTPIEMWRRIAHAIASVEEDPEKRALWERNFYWLLEDFRFVPGGRIMFGAGNPRNVTLLNCYVIPIKDDSLEAIFETAKEMARTYSFGGGVGTDISILRPAGTPVKNAAMYSTGAVSFMEIFSTTTGTIGQQGRRGALMITIDVHHPDVLEFIQIKNDPERRRVRFANISVKVTDEFMEAVERDDKFLLWFENPVVGRIERWVPAREIWNKLVYNAWASAEPGVIFWSTAKKYSTSEYNGMEILTTNPCSEIPLEPYGACCLGNINLSQFVLDPFTENARVDWANLERAAVYATRFLDNVLTYNMDKHPLSAQSEASRRSRRIGVGFTGLGDMLVKLNLKYDTPEAIEFVDKMFMRIKHTIYRASAELAIEKGPFPAFDRDKHFNSPFLLRIQEEDEKLFDFLVQHGLRNVATMTVPPVGSGALLAGTTSGIEPIFSLSYTRRSESLSKGEFKVYHWLVKEYMERFGIRDEKDLPPTFVTAHEIDYKMRVAMQAAIQKHVDHAISSTVNLPHDIDPETVGMVYFEAWRAGLKGITVYREGSREGVLITDDFEKKEGSPKSKKTNGRGFIIPGHLKPRPRKDFVEGVTYKFKTELGSSYITVNEDEYGPFEVFIHIGKPGSSLTAMSEAVGRLISLALRSGVDPHAIVEQLIGIKSNTPVRQNDGTIVFSVPDAVAKALLRFIHRRERTVPSGDQPLSSSDAFQDQAEETEAESSSSHRLFISAKVYDLCPNCGGTLIFENGCYLCRDCGYSKCE